MQFSQILDCAKAILNRDNGIKKAIDNANKKENWGNGAYQVLLNYIKTHRKPFLTEQLREYAEGLGLPNPPSKRAWGGIILKASKEGLIYRIGYEKTSNPMAHRTPATLWIAV